MLFMPFLSFHLLDTGRVLDLKWCRVGRRTILLCTNVTGTVRFFPHNGYYSHFTDEETDTGRLNNLSKAMRLENNHNMVGNLVSLQRSCF